MRVGSKRYRGHRLGRDGHVTHRKLETGVEVEATEAASVIARKMHIAVIVNDLVKGRSLDAVSTNLICEETGTSRSSFYRLFENKYDIPVWFQHLVYKAGVNRIGVHFSYRDGVWVTTTGLELLRPLLSAGVRSKGYPSTVAAGIRDRCTAMRTVLSEVKGVELTTRLLFQTEYCAYGEVYALSDWVTHENYSEDAAYMSEMLAECAPGELRAALGEPVSPLPPERLDLSAVLRMATA